LSTHSKTTLTPAVDLEETAELPQLSPAPGPNDPLSNTDAWISPVQADDDSMTQTLPTLSSHRGRAPRAETDAVERSQHEAEIGALRSDLASVNETRSHLENDLQSLGGNLRELEQMLNRKSEQLSVYEREVGQRDRRIAELEARLAELDSDLAARQSQYETELAARQARLDSEMAAAGEQRTALQSELSSTRSNYDTARSRSESQAAELSALKAERNLLKQRATAAEFDLAQWRARGERYRETLQSLEGRRGLYDGMIAEREAHISTLEQNAATRERLVGAREEDLRIAVRGQEERVRELDAQRTRADAAAATARERIAALESETRAREESLRELRTQSEESLRELRTQSGARENELNATLQREQRHGAEVEAQRTKLEADAAAARERIGVLEAETRRQGEALDALRAQTQAREQELNTALRSEQQRSGELESARAASASEAATARERIAALESETAQQAESQRELRVQLGAVRESLAQRNALIERVEAEAASSVAMLGNIQHNLEHMGNEEQAHLFARTDGDTGIVHLLGRRTTMGRTPDNDVRIDAEFISRHHAVALRAGAKTVIEDLNSTNGTYVNGQRINRRTLKDGDLVTLGKTEFRYSINKASGAAKPPG
jgi:chromosome segregation ATPase